MNKKYFIAIVLPEPIQQEVEAMKQKLFTQFGLKGALRSPAHITLHRPFEWKEEKEQLLIDALQKFEFGKAFNLELKNFNCFHPRVIYVDVLKNELLFDLHKRLKYYAQENLKLLNEVEDMRGFHPHVTIAFRDLRKNKFEEVWVEFKEKMYQASFEVKGFSLLRLESKWEELHYFEK
ncbi:MAG: RNA 2',3'-cyclic phosphodiesterase [Sphingobacteriaceae bacterium]